MAQQRGGGGRDQDGGQQQMRPNEVISAEQKLNGVLAELDARGEELAAVLPKDVTLAAFLALVNQALRNNPKLLRCTGASIVNACVKAAYDGLRIDGKEAAIVDAEERYQEGGVWKSRMVARYMPMVFGLIKQILQSGAAVAVKAVVVYANEAKTGRFTLLEGTTPGIHHQPFVQGEEKGEMIGAYAIATLASGIHKFEWMDKFAILDVQKESKTDKVWTRWPTEMWKKTAVRRLRKSLSGTSLIRDMEAAEMFPQFDRSQPHPQMAGLGHNAQSSMPPRPTRGLEYQPMTPFDLGNAQGFGDERETVDRDEGRREPAREQGRQTVQEQREGAGGAGAPAHADVEIPEDERAWGVWGRDVEKRIAAAGKMHALVDIQREIEPVLREASKAMQNVITGMFTDRAADIAADPDDGAAAGESGNGTAAGDQK